MLATFWTTYRWSCRFRNAKSSGCGHHKEYKTIKTTHVETYKRENCGRTLLFPLSRLQRLVARLQFASLWINVGVEILALTWGLAIFRWGRTRYKVQVQLIESSTLIQPLIYLVISLSALDRPQSLAKIATQWKHACMSLYRTSGESKKKKKKRKIQDARSVFAWTVFSLSCTSTGPGGI